MVSASALKSGMALMVLGTAFVSMVIFLLALTSGRYDVYCEELKIAKKQVRTYTGVWRMCQQPYNHRNADDAQEHCDEAGAKANQWPRWTALWVTVGKTYLCIDRPCTQVVGDGVRFVFSALLATWASTTFVIAVVLAITFCYANRTMHRQEYRGVEPVYPEAAVHHQRIGGEHGVYIGGYPPRKPLRRRLEELVWGKPHLV